MDLQAFSHENGDYFFGEDNFRGRNTEMVIMNCINGSDGYPSQSEFNRRMEGYIARKKRSERTVVSEEELAGIHALLTDPSAMRAEPDVSHRTWVKKTFILKNFANGTFVCHKDKGQSSPQPIASKEKMYFILKQAHASEGHGGRDKTAKAVKKTHSFIRKGLICLFLEVCPTCRARNEAVKKDKLANSQMSSDPARMGEASAALGLWGNSQSQLAQINALNVHRQPDSYVLEAGSHSEEQTPSISIRRAPTNTEIEFPGFQLSPSHIRSHTYPFVEGNYGGNYGTSLNTMELFSREGAPQLSNGLNSFNGQIASNFSFDLSHEVFGSPMAPAHANQARSLSEVPELNFALNNREYDALYSTQSPLQPGSLASNNVFESGNEHFYLAHQAGEVNERNVISNEKPAYEHPQFSRIDVFSDQVSSSQRDKQHESARSTKNELRSADAGHQNFLSPFCPVAPATPETSSSTHTTSEVQRSFTGKNHKHLSLIAPSAAQLPPSSFLDLDYSNSNPSTAGSLWTAEEEFSTPGLTSGTKSAMSTVSYASQELGGEPAGFSSY